MPIWLTPKSDKGVKRGYSQYGKPSGRIGVWQSYILGISLLGAFAVYQIAVDPITWDSVVAVGLFLIAVLPGLLIWGKKWRRKRTMFKPEYQHSETAIAFNHEIETSGDSQYVQVTLRMSLETHVEFVSILFDGQGTLPVIRRLSDWRRKDIPNYVEANQLPDNPEGIWFWTYEAPRHRLRGARITIGIEFLATDYFDGYLVTRLTCADGDKEHRLPFKVRRKAGQ